jgi:hypothetical protein
MEGEPTMARPQGRQEVKPTSIRFPKPIDDLWAATAKKMNLPKSAVLIIALRNLAKLEGIPEPEETDRDE